ncbi:uncharacterized protein LAJ45_02224 [Morchella importuna]|uniref:uncharacterized protein n=1 Tax=Morchella importuna TaxID=1174673 RepID=UPI001E8EB756|nr:uncharacterized protein LAJ45_02224 [Morchella importuna]KAH8153412.1 hypothetical protein LAJ45_02224 [Morchella importuna]
MDSRYSRMAGFLGVFLGLLALVDALPLLSLLARDPARGVGGAAAVSSTSGQTDSESFTDNTGRLIGLVIGIFIVAVLIVLCFFTYRNRQAKKRRLAQRAAMQKETSASSASSDGYVAAARPENAKLMDGKYEPDMDEVYHSGQQSRRAVDTQYKGSYMKP